MRGDILRDRLDRWIRDAGIRISVRYPAARAAAPATVPILRNATTLIAPLTGATHVTGVAPAVPVPARPDVRLACLWTDAVSIQSERDRRRFDQIGWRDGATVMVRVRVADAALDPANPRAGTVFDAAELVIRDSKEYRVLNVEPVGPSFGPPSSYVVWLSGNIKQ